MIRLTNRSLFHVHTFQCGHAEHVPDEAYILRAIDMGADSIWFADHAPFPGNPFGNRMKYWAGQSFRESSQDILRLWHIRIGFSGDVESGQKNWKDCRGISLLPQSSMGFHWSRMLRR